MSPANSSASSSATTRKGKSPIPLTWRYWKWIFPSHRLRGPDFAPKHICKPPHLYSRTHYAPARNLLLWVPLLNASADETVRLAVATAAYEIGIIADRVFEQHV